MTEKTKVAMLLPDLGGGGAQRVMLALARSLDRARFDLHLVAIGPSDALASDLPVDVSVTRLNAPRLRAALPPIVSALWSLRPQVAVSTLGYINLGLLAALPLLGGTKLIVREANVVSATLKALPRLMPARRLYAMLYPRAAVVIAQTQTIAQEIADVAPRAKARIAILPNPVDEAMLRARAQTPSRPPTNGRVLVAAGRLTHQKGFDRLIKLVPLLPDDVSLTIYGDGPERANLKTQIGRLGLDGRVLLAGFSDKLAAAIAGADAFILPSRWEGMPNVVLEALALGTPVIASAESGVEGIARQTQAGALSIAGTERDYADTIARVVADPASGLRASLLPAEYRIANVAERFGDLLARAAQSE